LGLADAIVELEEWADDDQPLCGRLDQLFKVVVRRAGVEELRHRCLSVLLAGSDALGLVRAKRIQAFAFGQGHNEVGVSVRVGPSPMLSADRLPAAVGAAGAGAGLSGRRSCAAADR